MDWHGPEDVSVLMYVEDSLSTADRRRFEAHLDECQACRAELGAARRLQDLTRSWVQQEPPAHLAQAIRSKLRQPHRRGWLLAAAALVLLLIGMRVGTPGPGPSTPVAPTLAQSRPTSPELAPRIALATKKVWTTHNESNVIALAGQVLTLGPHSELQVLSQSGNRYVLRLSQGDVRVQEHGETMAVVTEHLRVDPVGTDYQVFHTKERSRVRLFSGKVRVTSRRTGQVADLLPGRSVEFPSRPIVTATRPKPPSPSPSPSLSPQLPELAYPVRIPTVTATPIHDPLPDWDLPRLPESTMPPDEPWRRQNNPQPWMRRQREQRRPNHNQAGFRAPNNRRLNP